MKTSKIQHFLRSLILMIAILAISLTSIAPAAAGGVTGSTQPNTTPILTSTPQPRPPIETPNVSWNS